MNGGKNRKPHGFGYTIVEVMLFLAISGFMFVLAAIFINGKQANAEFRQGINDANTQLRTVMNDVVNGFYPSANNFQCMTNLSGAPYFPAGTKNQGQNLGCLFIGKVVQFGVQGSGNSTDGWSGYSIYSVAGRQFANGSLTQPPASFADSQPVAITSGNITQKKAFQWGITATSVCSPAPSLPAKCTSTTPGAIGFFGAFGSFDSSNTLQSGSQTVNLAIIPGSKLGDADEVGNIPSLATSGSILTDPNILICFKNGKGRTASITLGGAHGQQLSTDITMEDSRC